MTTIVLPISGAGTWTVPADCTLIDSVQMIAGGGDGQAGVNGSIVNGGGGGGGQYSRITNLTVTPGASISYQVGKGGGQTSGLAGGTPSAPQACDSWFVDPDTCFASGGGNAAVAGGVALGGFFSGPGAMFKGGDSNSTADLVGSPGGGGAAGPNGAGGNASEVDLFPFNSGGTGGGGANGGGASVSGAGAPGTRGGNNRLGTGGGTGATSNAAPGVTGTNGGGGGGGYGSGSTNHSAGGPGSQETIWGAYGPGGGGGGAGYGANANVDGGDGGGRGAGGGGAGGPGGVPGKGQDGLIVISYRGSGSADGRGRLYTRFIREIAA